MENQWRWVDITELKTDNPYLRLEDPTEDLERSIQAIGLLHPLVIDSENQVLAGGRRFQAMQRLGLNRVPVIEAQGDELQRELVSLDENLKRRPLGNLELEKCLTRAKELYEKIHPEKESFDPHAAEEKKSEEEEEKKEGFVEEVSASTGLGPRVIKSALKREILSSDNVRQARKTGQLTASVANEIVKLEKDEQDKILPILGKRPTREVRKLVKEVKTKGVDSVVEEQEKIAPPSHETVRLISTLASAKRWAGKIRLDEIELSEKDREEISSRWNQLNSLLSQILSSSPSEEKENGEEVEASEIGNILSEELSEMQDR